MEEKRKRRNLILGIAAVIAALGLALLPVLLRSAQKDVEDKSSILSAAVERGDIRTTISGGGTLTEEDAVKVSVPKGVEVTDYLAANGDWVEKGQPLAAVDAVSVMNTIATVQENLEHLDKELRSVSNPQTTAVVTAPAGGRVKAVYIAPGDSVADVMEAHGTLMVLSLDGLMALRLETEAPVNAGDTVTVTLPDGKELPGRVETRQGHTLTVTLTDDGPTLGDTAAVTAADGTALGSGELYVHSAWNLTAVSGTVGNVSAREEQQLGIGGRLCYLENMSGSGQYESLSAQRREYEETMLKLFSLYQAGAVTAPEEGRVAGIDTARVGFMRAGTEEFTVVLLADGEEAAAPTPAPDPNNTPAGTFKNKYAQVAGVTFGSITFLVQDESNAPGSYAVAPELDESKVHAEIMTSFGGVSLYELDEETGRWKTLSPSALAQDDLLYFVYDNDDRLIWIVRPPQEKNPAPEEEFDPGAFYGGGGGGYEEPFVMYDLTETELLHVVPQNTMTVKVSIDELDILAVAVGQEAEITVDALPGRAFTGTVSHIDPNGANQGGNSKYTITIAIDRDANMLSGMNATAILTVGVTKDVLTLPTAALAEKGGRTVVYTGFDEQTRTLLDPVEVTTGVSDGTTVEIRSGLEEGTRVWYSYYESGNVPDFLAGPSIDEV